MDKILCKDIENIILDYKYDIENYEKKMKLNEEFQNIINNGIFMEKLLKFGSLFYLNNHDRDYDLENFRKRKYTEINVFYGKDYYIYLIKHENGKIYYSPIK